MIVFVVVFLGVNTALGIAHKSGTSHFANEIERDSLHVFTLQAQISMWEREIDELSDEQFRKMRAGKPDNGDLTGGNAGGRSESEIWIDRRACLCAFG